MGTVASIMAGISRRLFKREKVYKYALSLLLLFTVCFYSRYMRCSCLAICNLRLFSASNNINACFPVLCDVVVGAASAPLFGLSCLGKEAIKDAELVGVPVDRGLEMAALLPARTTGSLVAVLVITLACCWARLKSWFCMFVPLCPLPFSTVVEKEPLPIISLYMAGSCWVFNIDEW